MNIVICAGGTGSIALQTGLYRLLDRNFSGVDTKILINAHDSGKSTGQVRQVMGGKILGPSDLRKNQTTRLSLEKPDSPWLKFLDTRFTVESSEAEKFCIDAVDNLHNEFYKAPSNVDLRLLERKTDDLIEAITSYFKVPLATKIDYTDFSLANIIYAGLAKENNYSLRKAGSIMANLMDIKDNVILNDDTSLFLGAVTKSGKRITDEGDIVSWGDDSDPFVDVFFTTPEGHDSTPVLCQEAEDALIDADLIILSSGTLWSSLIPTYKSVGFKEAIHCSKAKVIMVMNRQPDKDSPGQTGQEIVDILTDKIFLKGKIHVLADSTGSPQMNVLSDISRVASYQAFDLDPVIEYPEMKKVHDSYKLASAVGQIFFKEYLGSDYYMFDYDDTLVGRGNSFKEASAENVKKIISLNKLTKVGICTGNSIKAVHLENPYNDKPITVFADGGINKYLYNTSADEEVKHTFVECVSVPHLLPSKGKFTIDGIISSLQEAGIPRSKIENRGNAIIAIKPIDPDYKGIVLNLVNYIIYGSGLIAFDSGRTTVEIHDPYLSKLFAVDHALEGLRSMTYVGDELENGNDAVVASHPNLRCLQVSNPVKTSFFLSVLLQTLRQYLPEESGSVHGRGHVHA